MEKNGRFIQRDQRPGTLQACSTGRPTGQSIGHFLHVFPIPVIHGFKIGIPIRLPVLNLGDTIPLG